MRSFIVRERQIKTVRYHFTPIRLQKVESLVMSGVEYVRETVSLVHGCYELELTNSLAVFHKSKAMCTLCPTPGTGPRENLPQIHTGACVRTFIAA